MIAITAGSNTLTKAIAHQLAEKGYVLKILVSSAENQSILAQSLPNEQIKYYVGSILDVKILEELLINCSTILHLNDQQSFKSQSKFSMYKHNIEGSANLVNVALAFKCKKFVFLSSVLAIGNKSDHEFFDENAKWEDFMHAQGYGWSKHLAEREIWRGANEGLQVNILNPGFILDDTNNTFQFSSIVRSIFKRNQFSKGRFEVILQQNLIDIIIQLVVAENLVNEQFIASNGNFSYESIAKEVLYQPKSISNQAIKALVRKNKFLNWFKSGDSLMPNKYQLGLLSDNRKFSSDKLRKEITYNFLPKEQVFNLVVNHFKSIN